VSSLAGNDEAGEGVISTAIAVLIMAALGAVMWVGFQAIWDNASTQTTEQINTIGAP
jgi:type VI protein secretion system component VasF